MSSPMATAPLVTFGLIADVQYADVDDAWNYTGTSMRYYRSSLDVLKMAVQSWTTESTSTDRMRFAVNLGDLIDGKNVALGQTDVALERVLAPIEAFQDAIGPVHHCVGNHEMYNFTREQYIHKLLHHTKSPHTQSPHSLPPPTTDVAYYSFIDSAAPSIEFIVLDSYGRSVLGSPAGSSDHISSIQLLAQHNPNEDKNSSFQLEGADQRFVQYNGAIDDVQMTWLKGILDAASAERRQVVVFAHVPVHEAASGNHPAAVLWNCDEIVALLGRYAHCVRVVFSGHTHDNGHFVCDKGIHYVGLHAALECQPLAKAIDGDVPSTEARTDRAYASVDMFESKMHIRGAGRVPSRILTW
ncbi:hypothetical protein, variant [Aphanomyces invadans]|uniref:Calcineurin-like phosphoesterase domain-containing protein n=1 Tax=Aphanomyces invadans TaxID=157072 RepID=A0A024TYA8_9STRA|nr:hypothetical protein, variant [Aphanomyces invadans]ETV98954.1 hypothetical protein, variant [Aphanomyces invadans]|eukprot:XP_008872381.1 hypothetical protein, variant [Aphanomyces invadans]